jgi:hypothetical protein
MVHSKNGIWLLHPVFLFIFLMWLGGIYYVLTRQPESVLFLTLSPFLPLIGQDNGFFQLLPSFVHVFAFAVLSWWILQYRYAVVCCVFWLGINCLFEVGQDLSSGTIEQLPDVLNLRGYLRAGTFDWLDILACIAGAVLALVYMSAYVKLVNHLLSRHSQE